jgi:hypothetical protein
MTTYGHQISIFATLDSTRVNVGQWQDVLSWTDGRDAGKEEAPVPHGKDQPPLRAIQRRRTT